MANKSAELYAAWGPLTPRYSAEIIATDTREDPKGGHFTVYKVRAESLCGNVTEIWRRFSEFRSFAAHLEANVGPKAPPGGVRANIPVFPQAGWTDFGSKTLQPDFVNRRRAQLEEYVKEIVTIEVCVEYFVDFLSGDQYRPRALRSLAPVAAAAAPKPTGPAAEGGSWLGGGYMASLLGVATSPAKDPTVAALAAEDDMVVVSPRKTAESARLERLMGQNEELQTDVATLRSELETARRLQEISELKLADADEEMQALVQTVGRLESKAAAQATEVQHLHDLLHNKAEAEHSDLAKAQATIRKLDKKITELTESNREIRDKFTATEKTSTRNEQVATSMKKNCAELKDRVIDLEARLDKAVSRSEASKHECDMLRAQGAANEEARKHLCTELDSQRSAYSAFEAKQRSEVEALRADLEATRGEHKKSAGEAGELRVQLAVANEKIAQGAKEAAAVEAKLKEALGTSGKLEHTEQVLKKMTEQFKKVRTERDELKEKFAAVASVGSPNTVSDAVQRMAEALAAAHVAESENEPAADVVVEQKTAPVPVSASRKKKK